MKTGRGFLLSLTVLTATLFILPFSDALFHALYPELSQPVYRQDNLTLLLIAHLQIVALSSLPAIFIGVAFGIWVTRPSGAAFRPLAETVLSLVQSIPPVAVLALAVPLLGFGEWPALLALTSYGLLPIAHGTLSGLEALPAELGQTARALGMTRWQTLRRIELPCAMPAIFAGIRTSVVINIGTAALASTVGARTLGLPIIIGLSGFNDAYVIQGALLVALLAICVDLFFVWMGKSVLPGHRS